jgi:predicted DNA-binding transcriptional regulator AlpA
MQTEENKSADNISLKQQFSEVITPLAIQLQRIADHFDQPEPEIVGTPYLADKLGVSTHWIADQIRAGKIPKSCLAGGGNGRQWKLDRAKIDEWLDAQKEL